MPNLSIPAPRQARARNTIAKLIEATDAAIREGGEAAVRIQEISEKTGVSIGSIYHHFGDRDGLIRATHAHNYSVVIESDIPAVMNFMASVNSTTQLAESYDEMFQFVKKHFTSQSALERAAIIGTTVGRPAMQQELSRVQHQLNERITEVLCLAAQRGMLKTHLNPRAAAMVILGLMLGRAVAELDTEPVSDDEWTTAALSAAGGMFNGLSHSQLKAQRAAAGSTGIEERA